MKIKILKFIEKMLKQEREKPEYIKTASRKYKLALLIFFAATIMCLCPPVISVFIFKAAPLVVLTGGEWISVVSMLGGFYFAANIVQKHVEKGKEIETVIGKEAAAKKEQQKPPDNPSQ